METEKSMDITPNQAEHVDISDDVKSASVSLDDDPVYSLREQRKIIHRIDLRLIGMISLIHIVSLVDRGNLGAASIAGLKKELKLVGEQYVSSLLWSCLSVTLPLTGCIQSIIALTFFPTYVALQPIATVLFRKIGTIYFLSGITFLWGIVMV